jgi:2-amino-4-hydroxy-6-hydroxymethyldihydropteridine diphosphokinase
MIAYIGLGSNLENPEKHVKSAIEDLNSLPNTNVIAQSSLYSSPPMGPQDQPDYINAVVVIDTELMALDLLDALQTVELNHGRERKRRWGERTLDLDILVYDDDIISCERLTVPHPGIAERSFVLYPLAEVAPELHIPNLGEIDKLVKNCPQL